VSVSVLVSGEEEEVELNEWMELVELEEKFEGTGRKRRGAWGWSRGAWGDVSDEELEA
jgi:hypothetical protein